MMQINTEILQNIERIVSVDHLARAEVVDLSDVVPGWAAVLHSAQIPPGYARLTIVEIVGMKCDLLRKLG